MTRSPSARALAFAAVLALSATKRAAAQEPSTRIWDLELVVPVGLLGGHTTYRIALTDTTGTGSSELVFPLRVVAGGVRAEVGTRRDAGSVRTALQVTWVTSMAASAGTMKDSDWLSDGADVQLVGAAHPGKDIYSESDAKLDANVLEARLSWELDASAGLVVAPIAGLLYQRFVYDVSDVHQVGYGPYDTPEYTGSYYGKVLEYEVTYRAPYAGARAILTRGPIAADVDVWMSPFAHAEDRDDHLLRGKVATTDASGTAWQVSAGARFALGSQDFLQAQASLLRVSATGNQHQSFYAGPYAGLQLDVNAAITSSRSAFLGAYVHRF